MHRRRIEDQIQRSVLQHIPLRGVKGLVAVHYPSGGYRKPVEAKILAGLGVAKGVPDLLLWHAGRSYAVELKSESGRASEAQLAMLAKLADAGVYTALCHGVDRAIAVLEGWQLLRGKVR